MPDLKLSIKKLIEEEKLISKGDSVVLGLSGGPDSMCLLEILFDLQKDLDFTLQALHVNHMIRGKEADEDEAFLEGYCKEKGVPFKSVKLNVPKLAKENDKTEEEMGRDLRMAQLKMAGANKIALAHNKNDQAETLLMRILRGTGVSGLKGMDLIREDGVIRPLLRTDRTEIEAFVKEKGLPARKDRTNFEAEYTRNKIRLQLLPKLAEYNPSIVDALTRLADSAREDDAVLTAQAQAFLQAAEQAAGTSRTGGPDGKKAEGPESGAPAALKIKDLSQLDDAVFARAITLWLEAAGLTEDISAVHIKALRGAVQKNVGNKTIEFPHGYKILLKSGKLTIETPNKD